MITIRSAIKSILIGIQLNASYDEAETALIVWRTISYVRSTAKNQPTSLGIIK